MPVCTGIPGMSGTISFQELNDGITTALLDATRTAGQISGEDLAFQRSSNPTIVPLLDRQASRLLSLVNNLGQHATSGGPVAHTRIKSVDSLDDNWTHLVEVFDHLLEKADACLDEFTGVITRLSPSQEELIRNPPNLPGRKKLDKAFQTQNIAKPQLLFQHPSSNHDETSFKPLLNAKPHAIVPLEDSIRLEDGGNDTKHYVHPYEREIQLAPTPTSALVRAEPISYLPFESTQAILVDTVEGVRLMLEELRSASEIAIDLEHHDEHSYIGLVSLMQISTRQKDWVVDTLKPWRQDLQILNQAFADPSILKIFHGSNMDIIWLQRDLGLYIVGLFDTYHASWALQYPKHSLAFLLKKFIDFDAAKQYQTADWRIRPLPEPMFNYARSDTHFLLYIFDQMRNELIDKPDKTQPDGDLIDSVMRNSKLECLQRYERAPYDDKYGLGHLGWYNMLSRSSALLTPEQFSVFRRVHQWRDEVARDEDESPSVVMPKRFLFDIAHALPMDVQSLVSCTRHTVSKTFQARKQELVKIIKEARAAGSQGPEMKQLFHEIESQGLGRYVAPSGISATASAHVEVTFAPTAVKAASTADTMKPTSQLDFRQEVSAFWGSSIVDSRPISGLQRPFPLGGLYLTLPLPPLSTEMLMRETEEEAKRIPEPPSKLKGPIQQQIVSNGTESVDESFVIRGSRSSKRNGEMSVRPTRSIASGAVADMVDDESMEDTASIEKVGEDEAQHLKRKREVQEKRREKKQLKLEQAHSVQQGQKGEEEEPFDYESAPSVLHAKMSQEGKDSASKSANPYSKSLNAPKGMRKVQRELPGKSFTFKK